MLKLIPVIVIIVLLGLSKIPLQKKEAVEAPAPVAAPVVVTPPAPPTAPVVEAVTPPKPSTGYSKITIQTDTPQKELENFYGSANIEAILKINQSFSSFPAEIPEIAAIPKLFFISQRVQAFGAYEYGRLVRTGPVSSGKQSTPTANKLFFANWKGKEVISTINGEWLLKWNVNLDNFDGIGMHQYDMPGYPASHSCVRMLEADAMWVYNWVDQWILTEDGNIRLAAGTPVIVFGQYPFGKTAPWKLLTTNAAAVTLTSDELQTELTTHMGEIQLRMQEREAVLANKNSLPQ